ncbi:MAG: response regulator, partial [Thiohalorhabdaceae bacterium]
MRILLVEDDPELGPLLKGRLEELGFGTDLVTRGEEALLAVPGLPYDAAVLDLRLPDMDGLTVLGQFRGQGQNLPVLILTARDGVDDRVLGLDSGADDYLTKPFSSAELIARIKALLRRPGSSLGQT